MLVGMIFRSCLICTPNLTLNRPVYRITWLVYWFDSQNCKRIHLTDGMAEVESGNFCFSLSSTISRRWRIDNANGICSVSSCLLSSTAASISSRKVWSSCQNISKRVAFSLPLHLQKSSCIAGSSRSKSALATRSSTCAWEEYSWEKMAVWYYTSFYYDLQVCLW